MNFSANIKTEPENLDSESKSKDSDDFSSILRNRQPGRKTGTSLNANSFYCTNISQAKYIHIIERCNIDVYVDFDRFFKKSVLTRNVPKIK